MTAPPSEWLAELVAFAPDGRPFSVVGFTVRSEKDRRNRRARRPGSPSAVRFGRAPVADSVTGVLRTERLLLRRFAVSDATRFAELGGAWRIADTTISVPHPLTIEIACRVIARFEDEWESGSGATFAIALPDDPNQFVGLVGIRHINHEHEEGCGLGMSQEGRLRQRVRKWGQYEDVLLWSVVRGTREGRT